MKKTIKFHPPYHPARDFYTDNFVCVFRFSMANTDHIGTPYEKWSDHKVHLTMSDALMSRWRIPGALELSSSITEEMVKVALQWLEDHIRGILQRDENLASMQPSVELNTTNSPTECPYNMYNIQYPEKEIFEVEIKDPFLVLEFNKGSEYLSDRLKNVHLLQDLVNELPSMKSLYFDHPDFQAWHFTIKNVLGNIFGENSMQLKSYHEIPWNISSSLKDAEGQKQIFFNSLAAAEGQLRAILRTETFPRTSSAHSKAKEDEKLKNPALLRARRALQILEEQVSGYTELTRPAHLQIELEEKRREVAELEARYGEAPAGSGGNTTYNITVNGGQVGVIGGETTVNGGINVGTAPATGSPALPSAAPSLLSANLTIVLTRLQRLDDVEIDTLCLMHLPEVYDQFGRGQRRDEKINLILNRCRSHPEVVEQLLGILKS